MKLYDVNSEILRLLALTEPDEETGEIPANEDELLESLHAMQMERSRILEYLAKETLNARSEQAALRAEEDRLKERRKKIEAREARLLRILDRECGGVTTDLGVATMRYRTGTRVDVVDCPKAVEWLRANARGDCIREKDPEINKMTVRKLLLDGTLIPGLALTQEQSCTLK